MAAKPRTARQKAFAVSPRGWLPAVGESVYVRRTAGNLSVIKSVGKVTGVSLFGDGYEVTISRGFQHSVRIWHVDDLRPVR